MLTVLCVPLGMRRTRNEQGVWSIWMPRLGLKRLCAANWRESCRCCSLLTKVRGRRHTKRLLANMPEGPGDSQHIIQKRHSSASQFTPDRQRRIRGRKACLSASHRVQGQPQIRTVTDMRNLDRIRQWYRSKLPQEITRTPILRE